MCDLQYLSRSSAMLLKVLYRIILFQVKYALKWDCSFILLQTITSYSPINNEPIARVTQVRTMNWIMTWFRICTVSHIYWLEPLFGGTSKLSPDHCGKVNTCTKMIGLVSLRKNRRSLARAGNIGGGLEDEIFVSPADLAVICENCVRFFSLYWDMQDLQFRYFCGSSGWYDLQSFCEHWLVKLKISSAHWLHYSDPRASKMSPSVKELIEIDCDGWYEATHHSVMLKCYLSSCQFQGTLADYETAVKNANAAWETWVDVSWTICGRAQQ